MKLCFRARAKSRAGRLRHCANTFYIEAPPSKTPFLASFALAKLVRAGTPLYLSNNSLCRPRRTPSAQLCTLAIVRSAIVSACPVHVVRQPVRLSCRVFPVTLLFRTCLKSSQKKRYEGQYDELQCCSKGAFAVLPKSPLFFKPCKTSLYDPPFGNNCKCMQFIAFDYLYRYPLS